MRHSWGSNCFQEFIDRVDKKFIPCLQIAVHTRRHEIVGLLETTSRNVSNEKQIHYNSRKYCVEHAGDYYKFRKHTFSKINVCLLGRRWVWLLFYNLYKINQKLIKKTQKHNSETYYNYQSHTSEATSTNNLDHEIEKPQYMLWVIFLAFVFVCFGTLLYFLCENCVSLSF